jgi:hypothetical protein
MVINTNTNTKTGIFYASQGFLDIINSNVYTMIESKEWVILMDVWLMKEVH